MYFPPEIGSASHLFHDFANELTKRGHSVTVVTTFPRKYNLNNDQIFLLSNYAGKLLIHENIDGIQIIRVRNMPIPRDSVFLRGLEHFLAPISILLGGLFAEADVIIVYSPPLPLGLAGIILSMLKKSKLIVNIQDLYPQAAIDLGLIQNKILIKIFLIIEKLVYSLADHITVHSLGNKEHVLEKSSQANVTVIPNWCDSAIEHMTDFANAKHYFNLEGYFVVTYAGIMSYSQDIDTIIKAAELLKFNKNIKFLLVGDGPKKLEIEKCAEKLDNVILLPYQPKEKYSMLLSASDICLVTLDANCVKTPVVPRKLNDITFAGKPVIANVPLEGDVARIIRESNCGYCIEPKNSEALSNIILKLYNNPQLVASLGKNGSEYAKKYFSIDSCCSQYEKLFYD